MKNSTFRIVFALISIVFFASCEKVIKVDLNSASPQYVIEGKIDNSVGPYTVKITQTINFDKDNIFPGVDNAKVVVSDNTGIIDTLSAMGNGVYQTHTIVGAVGKTYSLWVKIGDRQFTATSTMPSSVSIDSLYSENAGGLGDNIIFMVPTISDPTNEVNFYNFKIFINNKQSKGVYCTDDVFFNGQRLSLSLFPDGGPSSNNDKIAVGDSVVVVLETIDSKVYDYFFSLGQTIDQSAASPSNPVTNLTGGALGYFSAHATNARGVRIPK